MKLRGLGSKIKPQMIATCLMIFMLFSLLWLAQPGTADPFRSSAVAASLTIKAGYSGGTFATAKVFTDSDFAGALQQGYSFMDSLPSPVMEAATGIQLTDLLSRAGIDFDKVKSFAFYTTDVPNGPYKTITKSILYSPRYYYPNIMQYWNTDTQSFIDESGNDNTAQAVQGAVQVYPMICISDNWVRGALAPDFSTQDSSIKYRLVLGQPANDPATINASDSVKWVYQIDVALNGTPPSSSGVSVIPVSGVSLDKTTDTINTGSTGQLTVTIAPTGATNQSVTWTSDNTAVATVSGNGLVTGVAPGVANITATTENGGFTVTCVVAVQPAAVGVSGVNIRKAKHTVTAGGSYLLTATITPDTATNQSVTWSSSNTAVATISDSGLVTGVRAGSAYITATTVDGGFTATCVVTVNPVMVDDSGAGVADPQRDGSTASVPVIQNQPVALNDITGHWAENNINRLVSFGCIGGYPDGSFKPDAAITRAEFATVLIKAFKLTPQGGKVFADTNGHWAKEPIATAAAHGIVSGYDDSAFGPDDLVTREQMALMIVQAARLAPATGETQFADSGSVSVWARDAVNVATENGIMKGYPDNTVHPQGNATRAEAVTAILNVLQ
jgi:uncharacterized protein YjdB